MTGHCLSSGHDRPLTGQRIVTSMTGDRGHLSGQVWPRLVTGHMPVTEGV